MLEYVNYHLHPIVREASSNTEDKSDFLRKLKPIIEVSENCYFINTWCKITLHKYPEIRRNKTTKNISWKLYNEGNSQKGNNYFHNSHAKFKQFYIQLKTLSTNQRCVVELSANHLMQIYSRTILSENIYISINSRKIINKHFVLSPFETNLSEPNDIINYIKNTFLILTNNLVVLHSLLFYSVCGWITLQKLIKWNDKIKENVKITLLKI